MADVDSHIELIDSTTAPNNNNTTTTTTTNTFAEAVRKSLDYIQHAATARPSTDKKPSTEVGAIFEEVRQSIDLVRSLQEQENKSGKKDKKNKVLEKAKKKAIDITEHEMPVEKLLDLYGSNFNADPEAAKGLSEKVAQERLLFNGPNKLKPPKKKPFIFKIIEQFTSLFSLLMIFAGFLCILDPIIERTVDSVSNVFLGVILWGVVILNASITLIQERGSEKVLEGFIAMQKSTVLVVRDGILRKVDAETLVLGDIVKIEAGDIVPADLRILHASGLKVDNSSLTGESDPQVRTSESSSSNPLETANLAFFGTTVLEGSGYGIVIRCGNVTVIGQIALLAGTTVTLKTPLRREIDNFVRSIGIIALTSSVILFVVGLALGLGWYQSFLFAIGVITANIPEGLIAVVTVCLTVSAKRLMAVNVLVKKLEHVETLGSTSVICSDKTGTLTQNRMTVVETWIDGNVSAVGYERMMKEKPAGDLPDFSKIPEESLTDYQTMVRACALCSATTFVQSENNLAKPILDRECIGDASETALIKFVETRNDTSTLQGIRGAHSSLYTIPFNSKNKWMLEVREKPGLEKAILFMKGAPERIISRCTTILVGGKVLPLDEMWKNNFQQAYDFFAMKGERVLGFAQMYVDKECVKKQLEAEESGTKSSDGLLIPTEGLTFIGMCALTDPPKVGVPEAIAKCKRAGIQVVMVTGDHPATAKAIAKQVGILEEDCTTREDLAMEEGCSPESIPFSRPEVDAVVLHGEEIDKLSSKEWRSILRKKQIVFSRTSPQQKLLIVSKFQEMGHCVAVTGDGTNDSPALRKADIGVAMNISGSAVSKDAAAIILMDDNFASIVNGVEEGRLIFDNLKKSIAYTLTHAIPEVSSFLAYAIFGIPLPLTGVQVLMIDLGTELMNAISLAYEPAESDIMNIPPRNKTDKLVGFQLFSYSYLQVGVIEAMGCFCSYFLALAYYGIPPSYCWNAARSNYFTNTAPDLYIAESGQKITAKQQVDILSAAQTAYFLCIVICQWATLMSTRTRRTSVFLKNFSANLWIYGGIIFAVALTCFFLYVPFISDFIFQIRPVGIDFWLYPIPWAFAILFYDEIRKLMLRTLRISAISW
ncbi:hypothetical protein FDP41_003312 [Naegleria fowleri]|uniref:Cation-transporting P-type ATPase N-terminal domain-containing protein n=1 Tax=Naegleria fowleri TaxID=5763 RepID=A0A6A5BWA8_NAEFO|nr:uncharacterized protein FDP41_003312 [Naegleria fowleri]KAF0977990.1 hypothetical protein FDP41_003312 [Naegleria fowleri]